MLANVVIPVNNTAVLNDATLESFEGIKSHYNLIGDQDVIKRLIDEYSLDDFLLWVLEPIESIFGKVEKTLHLFKCWDETEFHLVLTICSSIEDMDVMMDLEEKLFEYFESYPALSEALNHIVITQN
jgi:hypothetical protein